MRFAADILIRRASLASLRVLSVAFVLAGVLTGCSRTSNPTTADSQGQFLGTWGGTITSDAIGMGAATVVLDFQPGSNAFTLLSGTWRFEFPDPVFSTRGIVSGSLDTTGIRLVLFFDRGAVPCPGEAGGLAQRSIAANLTLTDKRMRGDYIVAGCPGGTLDLVRK